MLVITIFWLAQTISSSDQRTLDLGECQSISKKLFFLKLHVYPFLFKLDCFYLKLPKITLIHVLIQAIEKVAAFYRATISIFKEFWKYWIKKRAATLFFVNSRRHMLLPVSMLPNGSPPSWFRSTSVSKFFNSNRRTLAEARFEFWQKKLD